MSTPFDPPRPRPAGGGGGGGAAGFTPVLHTGRWTSTIQQIGSRGIIPDTVVENEGITPGNGTQNIPYGKSEPSTNVSYFKVSEEMAGVYTFTVMVSANAYSANTDEGPTVVFNRFLLGREGGNKINVITSNNSNRASQTDQRTFIFSVTTRLLPEEQMEFKWGNSFTLKGGNNSFPGAWMSITKVSN